VPVQPSPGTGFPSDSLTEYHRLNDDYVIRPNLLNHLTIGYNHRHIYEAPAYVNTFLPGPALLMLLLCLQVSFIRVLLNSAFSPSRRSI
jgi:hypothetical protein